MKPKERYLNYALLSSANCEPNQSPFSKEDIPIDLSTKRPPPSAHNFGLFHKSYEHAPFQSPPHGSEWGAKYCFPNLMAKHQYGYPPAIFPYLFINPNCLPPHEIERKHEEPLYEQFGLPYRLPQDGLIFPFKLDPYAHHMYRHGDRHSDGERAALSSESSSSSSVASSPYDHEFHHRQPPEYQQESALRRSHHHHHHQQQQQQQHHRPAAHSTQETTVSPSGPTKGSHVISTSSSRVSKLRKSYSQPNLLSVLPSRRVPMAGGGSSLRRTKSEQNLHLIKSYNGSPNRIGAPKKMFASNYYQNMKENSKECKENSIKERSNNGTPTRFYRNYRKEVIESWDNENKDSERTQADDALDLRMNTPVLHKLPNGLDKAKLNGYDKLNGFPADCHSDGLSKLELKHPVALPMDIYRQYYYYLIQEPAFASRAAVAAVAETYAKLLHSNADDKHGGSHLPAHFPKSSSSPVDKLDSSSLYETKRASPDFILSGSRAELRSADTTNCGLPFDRKRISRPLTGKHVRQGTGASPSTLVSLRNMIQQRQKLKEVSKFDPSSRYGKGKANKRIKRK